MRIRSAPEFQPLNKWSSRENTKLKESEEAHKKDQAQAALGCLAHR